MRKQNSVLEQPVLPLDWNGPASPSHPIRVVEEGAYVGAMVSNRAAEPVPPMPENRVGVTVFVKKVYSEEKPSQEVVVPPPVLGFQCYEAMSDPRFEPMEATKQVAMKIESDERCQVRQNNHDIKMKVVGIFGDIALQFAKPISLAIGASIALLIKGYGPAFVDLITGWVRPP